MREHGTGGGRRANICDKYKQYAKKKKEKKGISGRLQWLLVVLCWHRSTGLQQFEKQFTAGHTEECLAHAVNPVTLRRLGQGSYSYVLRQPERQEAGATFYSVSVERTHHFWFTQVSNNTPMCHTGTMMSVSFSARNNGCHDSNALLRSTHVPVCSAPGRVPHGAIFAHHSRRRPKSLGATTVYYVRSHPPCCARNFHFCLPGIYIAKTTTVNGILARHQQEHTNQ